MEDILSELFSCAFEVSPCRNRADRIADAEDYLINILKEEDREFFLQYAEDIAEESAEVAKEMFERGFRAGAKIILAVFFD